MYCVNPILHSSKHLKGHLAPCVSDVTFLDQRVFPGSLWVTWRFWTEGSLLAACEWRDVFGPKGHSWQPVSDVTVLDQRVFPGSLWVTWRFWTRGSFLAACELRDGFGPSLSGTGSGLLRAERRRREARREIFTTPRLVTARRSILGPPTEGRPGPSDYKFLL